MHMSNELLSPAVALGTGVLAIGGIGLASKRIREKMNSHLVPLMGVMGAFVFAAQMVNFTLPTMAGTSDHLIGTTLLAILLGPSAAVITITGVLVIQCLVFQDGGLLALGANIINMGLLPAFAAYGIWRMMTAGRSTVTMGRLLPAAWTASFVAVTLGAIGVCAEVGISQRLAIPLSKFTAAMVGVHMLSGAIEGIITCAVLVFLYRLYPELSSLTINWEHRKWSKSGIVTMFAILAIVTAGVLSWLASPYADGLEWAVSASDTLKPKTLLAEQADQLQEKYTPLPDYNVRTDGAADTSSDAWPNVNFWTSFSGLLGVGLTMLAIWGANRIILRRAKSGTG